MNLEVTYESAADDRDKKRQPRRVLVVDDEMLIRWSLTEALSDAGCIVREAEDAKSALRVLADGSALPDVVLLDYRLPDSEGLELLSRIVSLAPNARVILMTAFGTTDMMQDAIAKGAERVLHKPFEVQFVTDLVDTKAASRPS